jgi:hypothetical protein
MARQSRKNIEREKYWYAGLDTENKIIANILLRLAKEVDDGIFYAKRKNRLDIFRRQADKTGQVHMYNPWWALNPNSKVDINLIEKYDKEYNIPTGYRDMMKNLEEFRMTHPDDISEKFPYGGMRIRTELMGGKIEDIMPETYLSIDFTEQELDSIRSKGAYARMSSIANMPFQPSGDLQNNLLNTLYGKETAGTRLLAPGGSGKSTLFMFFGRAAAQHSLSHPTLWWKPSWGAFSFENVSNLSPGSPHHGEYWERRFVKFESSKLYVNPSSGVGGAQGPNLAFEQLAADQRYKDIFVFVLEEFASGMGLSKCGGENKDQPPRNSNADPEHSALGQFEKIMKPQLDPGHLGPPSKFILIYAPENDPCVQNAIFNQSQWSSRFTETDFPLMNTKQVREAVNLSLFSNYTWKGILEEKLGMEINISDKDFSKMYSPEVRKDMIDAIMEKLDIFIANANRECSNQECSTDPISPMRAIQFILGAAKTRASIRQNLAGVIQDSYNNWKAQNDLYEIKTRELNNLKNKLPKESVSNLYNSSRIVISKIDEILSEEQINQRKSEQQQQQQQQQNANKGNLNIDSEKLNSQISQLEIEVQYELKELAKSENKFDELKEQLESLAPGVAFAENFRDIGFIKPIDIRSIANEKLTYSAMKNSEEKDGKKKDSEDDKEHSELRNQSQEEIFQELVNND